jgi:large subunit ribosomal protein L4
VSGGGKKPWRQKGTGRARAGTIRSPLWRGGGKTFASSNQDYSQKLNKKMYRAAMRAILSELVRQDRLLVIDDFDIAAPKTRELAEKLTKLGVDKGLLVTPDLSEALFLSARNLPNIGVCDVAALNPVNLVGFNKVVMTVSAVKQIEEAMA